jgi:hypothetical protein
VGLGPVVVGVLGVGVDGPVHLRLALLGHPQLHGFGRRLHVPVAERLGEEYVDRGSRVVVRLVAGPRALAVVGDDLQPSPVLEVDRAQRHALPGRLRAPSPTGGHGAHQMVGVEQQWAQQGERVGQRFGHVVSLARVDAGALCRTARAFPR